MDRGAQLICRKYHVKCWAGWVTSWNQGCQQKCQHLRYADGTTLMAESEEELKSLLMKVKEESKKAGLKLNMQKTKITASSPISSVQFSHSAVSDSLRPHESQHARTPCPSPAPRVHWLTSIESVMPYSHLILGRPLLLLPQSLPASESFPMSQLFAWGGQSTGVSASASLG